MQNDFSVQGYEYFELSTQLVIKEAIKRGVSVEVLDASEQVIRLRKGDKSEIIFKGTKTSIDTYTTALILENKWVQKHIMQEHNMRVPKAILVEKGNSNIDRVLKTFEKKSIVIKPKDTNFGLGITILKHPYTQTDFNDALIHAFIYGDESIVEEFIEGPEYRFLVINFETISILNRVPANVIGDGLHTIDELVAIKNDDPMRGVGYMKPLEKIKIGDIEKRILAEKGYHLASKPPKGTIVYLRKNSNISTGGDSIDVTDDVHSGYKRIAEQASRYLEAKFNGIDIIIPNIKEPQNEHNYSIIESNFNPALFMHDYPYSGKRRNTAKHVLDTLGF